MPKQIDQSQVLRAARNSIPLTIKSYTLPHETEIYLEEILGIFLRDLGQEQLKDPLAYCLRELAINAKKANTKRVYFEERDLRIGDDADYQVGMRTFKNDTLDNIDHYLELQKQKGLYVKIVFHTKGRTFSIAVKNNVPINKKEQMRVYDRIAHSRAFESLEQAFSSVLDDSEGAGLGIVILILMLKKIGLDEDAFDIDIENGETVARIVIPVSEVRLENLDLLSEAIVDEISALPQFPENIVYLQQLISDPESEIADIARQISTDPSLTADLLKLVNSAQFMLPKRVDNIVEAVKLVGLRTLKNLLYSYGTQKLLDGAAGDQKSLWDHSYRTAFYAYYLAKSFKRKKDILDDVYVGGILHDMGKIIFSSVHPYLLEKIQTFCREKGIPRDLIEDFSAGLNHAEIGARIAEKWNFPDPLVEAIRYHHEPTECSPQYREVVSSVYLANAICNIESDIMTYDQLEPEVLRDYGIANANQLQLIKERLSRAFDEERDK
jgi:putative nucleotidyltransferase with HDIG domain